MSCRIYTATNANCIVGGEPPAGEKATIREDFEAGVSLVVDTTGAETTVRGAVPAHRDAPEALVGVVTVPRGDDPLRSYHDAVRDVFDDRSGWRVRTDVVNGRLFEALGRPAGPTAADELLSSIRTRRRDAGHAEVGVPDATNAIGLLRSLLERGSDGVYVISTQEPPDHVETDVFVHLADRYTEPELIDLETDLSPGERVGRRVDELVDELSPPEVAARLESETQQRDVPVAFESDSSGGGLTRTVLAGVGVGLAVAVLLAGVRIAAGGAGVTLDLEWLPIVGSAVSLPPWAPLVAGLVAVIAAVSVPAVRRALGGVLGVGSVLGSRDELESEQRERLETVAAILEQQALEMDGDPYRTAKSALQSRPIQPVRRSAVHKFVGLLGSLLPAVVIVGAAWVLLGVLSTGVVTLALFGVAAVALGGRIGIALGAVGAGLGKLLSGGSSSPEDERQRQGADGTASQRDDDSELGIRASDEDDEGGLGIAGADGSEPTSDPADPDRESSDPSTDEEQFPIGGSERDDDSDETEDGTTGTVDPADDDAEIAPTGEETDEDRESTSSGSDTPGSDSTDSAFDGEQQTGTAGDESEDDETNHLFDSSTNRDEQESRDVLDGERTASDDGDRSPTVGEDRSDGPEASADEAESDSEVGRANAAKPAGSDADEPTTRGPFERFFGEYPVTTAPVVTDERVFVAGDAGLHDRSVPVDRSWLPQHHLDTVRLGSTQAHLTRLTRDGEHDHTIPFTSPFAEPIVGGDSAVYVVDSSLTVAALGEVGSPAIQTFQYAPDHFSADHLLYVSDRRGSRFYGPDLGVQKEFAESFSVSPMVTDDAVTLCFDDGQTRRINRTNNRATEFPTPGERLVGSAVAGGTPYVASESGEIWAGWEGGWKDPTRIHTRVDFRWFSASDSTLVLAGDSIVYTHQAGTHGVDSLERDVSSPPVVTDDSVYFASNGELVRADPELNTTARIDLPWRSIDGLTAGDDRLFVVADGAVWTVPFSAVR